METIMIKVFSKNGIKIFRNSSTITWEKYYCTNPRVTTKKNPHPYRHIHPWNSVKKFAESLVKGVIHNEDGLVVINKPYGITAKQPINPGQVVTGIVNAAPYTLDEAMPLVATELDYPSLKVIKTPEKYMTGVTILAANNQVEKMVNKCLERAQGMNMVPKTYWAVTTRVPNELKGEMRLAMRRQEDPRTRTTKPIIITSWSKNEQKRREIKILNVQFKVISNSTENLSSLIEIKSSTKKWHAIRMFAATVLYSPILGDNVFGSRVKNVLGKWMNISPFVEAAEEPPKLSQELQQILKLTQEKRATIPVHLHLREIYLPMYGSKTTNLVLTAPPMPEFTWTCQQLQFKHELFADENDQMKINMNADLKDLKYEAVT